MSGGSHPPEEGEAEEDGEEEQNAHAKPAAYPAKPAPEVMQIPPGLFNIFDSITPRFRVSVETYKNKPFVKLQGIPSAYLVPTHEKFEKATPPFGAPNPHEVILARVLEDLLRNPEHQKLKERIERSLGFTSEHWHNDTSAFFKHLEIHAGIAERDGFKAGDPWHEVLRLITKHEKEWHVPQEAHGPPSEHPHEKEAGREGQPQEGEHPYGMPQEGGATRPDASHPFEPLSSQGRRRPSPSPARATGRWSEGLSGVMAPPGRDRSTPDTLLGAMSSGLRTTPPRRESIPTPERTRAPSPAYIPNASGSGLGMRPPARRPAVDATSDSSLRLTRPYATAAASAGKGVMRQDEDSLFTPAAARRTSASSLLGRFPGTITRVSTGRPEPKSLPPAQSTRSSTETSSVRLQLLDLLGHSAFMDSWRARALVGRELDRSNHLDFGRNPFDFNPDHTEGYDSFERALSNVQNFNQLLDRIKRPTSSRQDAHVQSAVIRGLLHHASQSPEHRNALAAELNDLAAQGHLRFRRGELADAARQVRLAVTSQGQEGRINALHEFLTRSLSDRVSWHEAIASIHPSNRALAPSRREYVQRRLASSLLRRMG